MLEAVGLWLLFGATNDNNVEWDGLYHQPNETFTLSSGDEFYYRDRNSTSQNTGDPSVDDDDTPCFYVRVYKNDITAAYFRTSADNWTTDHSMSWVGNDPSDVYDFWGINSSSIIENLEPGTFVYYHFKIVDGTDTENYLKADGIYETPLSGTDFYFMVEGIRAVPSTAVANGDDKIYIYVYVTDELGQPVSGETVTFSIVSGSATLNSTTAVTSDNGLAQVYLTSTTVGTVEVSASSTNFNDASTRTVTVEFLSFVIDGDSSDWDAMLGSDGNTTRNSMSNDTYMVIKGQGIWRDSPADQRADVSGTGPDDDLHWFRITGDTQYLYFLAQMGGNGDQDNPMLYVAFDTDPFYNATGNPPDGKPGSGAWQPVPDKGVWSFGCTWDDWLEMGTANKASTPVERWQKDFVWTIDGSALDGGNVQASSNTDYWADYYYDSARNGPKNLTWDYSPVTHELYLGIQPYNSYDTTKADYFVFLANLLTSTTRVAPWAKSGSVMEYQYKMAKDNGGWAGWQYANDTNLNLSDLDGDGNTYTVATGSTGSSAPLEGKIDLDDAYPDYFANGTPERIYVEGTSYGPNNGDGVWDPLPLVNSDGDWNTLLDEDFMRVGLKRTGSTYDAVSEWERFFVACTGKTRLYKPNQQKTDYGSGYSYIWLDSNYYGNIAIETKLPWSDLGIDPTTDFPKRIRITVAIAQQQSGRPKEVYGPDAIDVITNETSTWNEVGSDYSIPGTNGDDPTFYGDIDYYLDIDFNKGGKVNVPPGAPVMQSPTSGILVNSEPTLVWSFNDPDGDVAVSPKVWLQIYKDADNDGIFEPGTDDTVAVDVLLDGFVTSYSGYTLDSDYRYFWRVKTRDDFSWSPWSEVRSFRLDKNPPTTPSLSSPANGDPLNYGNVTLTWSASSDSYSGVAGYEIEISNSTSFEPSSTFSFSVPSDTSYTFNTNPFPMGIYYWRVRAYDNAGNPSSWSTAYLIKVDYLPPVLDYVLVDDFSSPPSAENVDDTYGSIVLNVAGSASASYNKTINWYEGVLQLSWNGVDSSGSSASWYAYLEDDGDTTPGNDANYCDCGNMSAIIFYARSLTGDNVSALFRVEDAQGHTRNYLLTFEPQWKMYKYHFAWDFWDINTTAIKCVGFLMDQSADPGVSSSGSVMIGDIYIVKGPYRVYPTHQGVVYDPTPTLRWLPAAEDLGPSGVIYYDIYISNGTSMNWGSLLETAYNLNTDSYTMSTSLAEGWYSWEMSYHDAVKNEAGSWTSNWIGCDSTYNFYAMPQYTRNITSIGLYSDSSFTTPVDKVSLGQTVYVKVVGEDSDSSVVEKAIVTVFSDADPIGLRLECNETAASSGVFSGSFVVSSYTNRNTNRIRVRKGGWIKVMGGNFIWTQDAINDVGGNDWPYGYYARYVDLTGDVFNGGGAKYDIKYVDVSSNETHIFFRITVNDNISEDYYHQFWVFIDSDRDSSTGTNTDPYTNWLLFRKYSGFDYKVFYEVYGSDMETDDSNNAIYRWDGSSWTDTGAKTVHGTIQAGLSGSNNTIEFAVAKSDIGVSGSGFYFLVYYFNSANWNYGDVYPDETIRFATPAEYLVIDSARDSVRVISGGRVGNVSYYADPSYTVPATSFDVGSTVYFEIEGESVDDSVVENITMAVVTTSSGVSDTLFVNATETSASSGIFRGNFTLWSSTVPSERKVKASAGDEFLVYPIDQVSLANLGGSETADTMDRYAEFIDERGADYAGSLNTHTVPWSFDSYGVYVSRNQTHLFIKVSAEDLLADGAWKDFLLYLDVDNNDTNGGRPDWDWGNVYKPAYDYKVVVSVDGSGNAGGNNYIYKWDGSSWGTTDLGDAEFSATQTGDSFLIGLDLSLIGSPYTRPIRLVVILNPSSGETDYVPNKVSSPPDFWYLGANATGYVGGPLLYITEVAFDESSGDWIELYVESIEHSTTCNLGGYLVTDLDGTDTPLPYNITLSAGEYLIVHFSAGGQNETDSVGDVNGNGVRDIYLPDPGFTATDDQAVVKNPVGVIVDAVAWSNANGAFTSGENTDTQSLVDAGQWDDGGDGLQENDTWQDSDNIDSGESIARKFYANGTYVDTNSASDWLEETTTTVPTPGKDNWVIVAGNIKTNVNSDYVYPTGVACVLDFNITDPWDESTQDNITALRLFNNGTLPVSNFTDVSVFIDSGDSGPDGFFSPYGWDIGSKGPDTTYATSLTYNSTGGYWEAVANATIPAGGSLRFFVAARVWVYADTSRTVQFGLIANGTSSAVVASAGVLSSNGVHGQVCNPSVQNIRPLYITINELLINAPGTTTERNYEYFELFNFGHGASSLNADPVGENWKVATQGGFDEFYYHDEENQTTIAVGHYAIYTSNSTVIYDPLQVDWDPNPDAVWYTTDDSYIGTYGLTNSGGGLYILHGRSIVSYFNWGSGDVPSENITLEKKSPFLDNSISSFQESSVQGGTPGYYNGFRFREMQFSTRDGGYLFENQTNVMLLSFVVPDNLGNPDTLTAITVENRAVEGYSVASSSDFTMKLWADDGDGVFNATADTLVGTFSDAGSNLYTLTGLSVSIPSGGKRFFITVDIPVSPSDGVSVRPVIGPLDYPAPFENGFTLGIRTSSGNCGPVDEPLNYSRYKLYAESLSEGMKLDVDNPPDPDGGWIGAWWWNYGISMTEDTSDYVEGNISLNVQITGSGSGGAGLWWQFGYNSTTTPTNPMVTTNMTLYKGGWLRFFFKAVEGDNNIILKIEWNDTSTNTKVGSERKLYDFYSPYDGSWHRIDIPLSEFSGVEFHRMLVPIGFHIADTGNHTFKIDYLLWETPFWIIDNSVPDAPSQIYAYAHSVNVGDSANYVELNWTDSASSDVIGYIVFRSSSGGGPWTQISNIIYTTSFNDTSVSPGDTWYYRVVAVDDAYRHSSPTISITAPLIKISKEASPSQVLPFDNLTYTIYFTNWGYGPAENLIVVENINTSYVTLVSAQSPSGYTVTIEYYVGGTWQTTYSPSATAVRWVFSSVVPPATSEPQGSITFIVRIR